MIQDVYLLFNSFCFNKEFESLFSQKESEPQKPLWFKINKPEFEELTRDIYNNQDIKDFKITINKRTYDLKNAKKIWTEVATRKISKNDAKKLYKELIQKDIHALEGEKCNNVKKYNILNILNNVGTIFDGGYLHYKGAPKETIFERTIVERSKLRKEKIAEI